jgi:hypothetical protein
LSNRLIHEDKLLLAIAQEANGCVLKRSLEGLCKDGFLVVKNSLEDNRSTVDLTLWGLFRVLERVFEQQADEGLTETLDKIAFAQAQKLVIFKKWGFFEEQGMKMKAIELLGNYFRHQQSNFYCVPISSFINEQVGFGFKRLSPQEVEMAQLESFYNYVFLVYDFLPRDEQWYKLLAQDEELRAFALERLQFYRQVFAVPLKEIDCKASFLENR